MSTHLFTHMFTHMFINMLTHMFTHTFTQGSHNCLNMCVNTGCTLSLVCRVAFKHLCQPLRSDMQICCC